MLYKFVFLCPVFSLFSTRDFFGHSWASGTFLGNEVENERVNLSSHAEFSSDKTLLARCFSPSWHEAAAVSGSCIIGSDGRNMGFPGKDSCKSWYLR